MVPPDAPARVLLVVGAGRSGTSTVTGALHRLGFAVPQPEVATDETNPKGFGEPRWAVDFHDRLLARTRVQVSDARPEAWALAAALAEDDAVVAEAAAWLDGEVAASSRVVVKDPRLAWFLPVWQAALARTAATPAYLTMLRPPSEVVGSKRTYYNAGLDDAQGVAAWLNTLLGTELATRGGAGGRTFVRYHDLLEGWRPAITRAAGQLALPDTAGAVDGPGGAAIDAFIDPGLRRIQVPLAELGLPGQLRDLTERTWTALDRLVEDPAAPAVLDQLDAVRAEFAAYYAACEAVTRSTVIAERQRLRARNDQLRAELEAARRAVPGTVPLRRRVRRRLGRVRRAVRARLGRT